MRRAAPHRIRSSRPDATNRRRIKKYVRSLQRRKPRAFRIPLVPANERAYSSIGRIKGLEPEIAGSEIEFFVVKRIVGNVHLAVNSQTAAVRIEHDSRVVI